MQLPDIRKVYVQGKRVFLRADLDAPTKFKIQNSPLRQGFEGQAKLKIEITDDTRLVAALTTIAYLRKQGAEIIIGAHFGRPTGFDKKLSLEPIAKWLQKQLKTVNRELKTMNGFAGWKIAPHITLLENLRFYAGEKANDDTFANQLASLADLYVNDAFAVCHRANASIVAVTGFLPSYAGIHLQDEVKELGGVLERPKRPLLVIIGGAKIETKLPLVEKMHHIADYVLVGGKIVAERKKLLQVQHEKLAHKKSLLLIADMNDSQSDITQNSMENFLQVIPLAKTIVWNGPLGIIEEKNGMTGTRAIAKAIVKSHAHSIVGGGNTIGFLRQIGVANKFSFLSTGGGAMLSFLSGETLPGLAVLEK